jgi:hypothetical protein
LVPEPIAGLVLVLLITIPFAVTADPPSAVTLPPVVAEFEVMADALVVDTVGQVGVAVVN